MEELPAAAAAPAGPAEVVQVPGHGSEGPKGVSTGSNAVRSCGRGCNAWCGCGERLIGKLLALRMGVEKGRNSEGKSAQGASAGGAAEGQRLVRLGRGSSSSWYVCAVAAGGVVG